MLKSQIFLTIFLLISCSGVFSQAVVSNTYGTSVNLKAVSTGDLNSDGIMDVLWHNPTTGELSVWLLGVNGVVTEEQTLSQKCDLASNCGASWQVVGIGKFNSDTIADILWHNSATGEFSTWLLDTKRAVIGKQTLSQKCEPVLNCTPNWQVVGTGNFNSDGVTDILWHNLTTGELSTWLLNVNGTVVETKTLLQRCNSGLTCQVSNLGDFNADGLTDILWYDPTANNFPIWLLDANATVIGTQTFTQKCSSTPHCTVGWEIIGTGDFNANGTTDLFWHNVSLGEPSILLMDQNGTVSQSTYSQQEYTYSTQNTDEGTHSESSYNYTQSANDQGGYSTSWSSKSSSSFSWSTSNP